MKKNVILTDSDKTEIQTFANAIESVLDCICPIYVSRGNFSQKKSLYNIFRYIKYFLSPLIFFFKKVDYDILFGWQQFYAINLALYNRLFKKKKRYKIVVLNFTYKKKRGVWGLFYHKYMKYSIDNMYIDYIHVPSYNYIDSCISELGIDKDKFIVSNFGVPDLYNIWNDSNVYEGNYCLSIGRSNRDFDFLISAWKSNYLRNFKLIIISDTYIPKCKLPANIILKNDISGNEQFPWLFNAEMVIVPILDGGICSGDTVLLNSMMFKRPVVVTKPSTLYEMYIEDGVNGFALEKDLTLFSRKISDLLMNPEFIKSIGENARDSYLHKYSRYAMGERIANKMLEKYSGFSQ